MKIFISRNGLTYNIDTYFTDTETAFNAAITKAGEISCPSSFKHYSYLTGISKAFTEMKNTMLAVEALLLKCEGNYEELDSNTNELVNKVHTPDIIEKIPVSDVKGIVDKIIE